MPHSLVRRALAEFIGTALLVTAVIGSGIAASRLSPGNLGLELLENAAATIGAAYFFTSSTSFANPAVTIARMFSNTFALVPFIPGLRSLPRWIPVYRLIWRDYYRGVEGRDHC